MKRVIFFIVITTLAVAAYHLQADAQDKEDKAPLEAVYNSYFAIKDALVKSDGQSAQRVAETLYDNISAVPMNQLSTDQHEIWMKYQKQLSSDAEQIKKSAKVDQQRKYFASLSKSMYQVMKAIKPGKTVYYQHCPMYNKGADWLSLEEAIKNPYYGSAMLTCGSTKETIK